MSIGIWQIGIVIFGLTFGILILYFLYIAGIAVCEKSTLLKKLDTTKLIVISLIFMVIMMTVGIDGNNVMGLPGAFGFSFGAWLWTLIPAFIRKMRKKSKKIFDKNFSYGWFGVLFGQILSVFLNEIL